MTTRDGEPAAPAHEAPIAAPALPAGSHRSLLSAWSTHRWMLLALAVAALTLGVLMVFTSGAVPRADEWNTPGDLLRARVRGHVTFAQIFCQHNESRVIFAPLLTAALAEIWGWNQHVLHGLNWLITCFTALLFVRLTAQSAPTRQRLGWPVVLVLCAAVALVFSPVQWRNLLSSGQIITISIPCLLLGGVTVNNDTTRAIWVRYLAAALCSLVASFSFVNGLMLWFLLWPAPFIMAKQGSLRIPRREILASAAYFAVALVVIVAFFADYHTPAGHPPLASGLLAPHKTVFLALTLLAGPIFPEPLNYWMGKAYWIPFCVCGALAGLVGLVLLTLLYRVRRSFLSGELLRRLLPFGVLLAYSLLSAASIALARVGLGMFGNVSRYSTVAIPGYLGLAGTLAMLAVHPTMTGSAKRVLPWFAAVFFLAVLVSGWFGGIGCIIDKQAARQAELSLAMRKLAPGDPLLTNVFPVADYVSQLADELQDHGVLAAGPSLAWIRTAPPEIRNDVFYRLAVEPTPAGDMLWGRVWPSGVLEADDLLLLWDEAAARPVTAILAPAATNYPGKPDGVFAIRFDRSLAGPFVLAGRTLRLVRPRTHEVWRLVPATEPTTSQGPRDPD